VQTREWQAMMKKCNRFVPIEELFKGRHFDGQIIVCRLVHELQAEPTGSGNRDGGLRHLRDAYNDSPVGPALRSGIREALVALRSARGRIVEDGRDLYKGSGDDGCTCTAPSTRRVKQLISFAARTAT
jgi:hypothetical protein